MEDIDKTPVDQALPRASDPDKTPADAGTPGTFSFLSGIFTAKVVAVADIAHYLTELSFNPEERDQAYWRLHKALGELLEVGNDFRNVVASMMPNEEIEIEI